ncbi:COX15/CtaA family protein [Fervidibacillus halotolerans]|uniref:Heme A synthase n=1 Tax=Fervidibacillus halotolerans TaxID=2980027 RepID=A0A9E8M348_9BACI|nr:heme A synthase [Fervidibacillus halotolerans]WAA13721.1 heme A synthase [Fervidibacillus halotolerans]
MHQRLKWISVLSTFGMLGLLIGGALVTKTDSGDGCGTSWPLCHGKLFPDQITPELLIEFSHRISTGIVFLLVLLLSYWSIKQFGRFLETKILVTLSLSFIIIQSLIGAATVIWGQSPFFLALHFGISLISFAAVLLLTIFIFEIEKIPSPKLYTIDRKMIFHTYAVTIYSYIVIYTGALVRHMDASMICPDWPFCNNEQITLPRNMYEWVQMGHRLAAGIIFIWILYLMIKAIRNYKHISVIYYGWIAAFILVLLQVISGAFVIFTQLNLIVTLLHALFISCLFGLLSYFVFISIRSSKNNRI